MTTERKPFEKKELPAKKPILCRFGTMPKEGKPAVFEGKESPRISLMFRVADTKYPDLAGYPVFFRCNPWINNYQGKSTKLYNLLSEMQGEDLPDDCCQVDARDLIKEDWERFFGYYVVKMDAPEFDEAGALKWQDIEEILNPEGIEFPVESRRLERHAEPVGLPKAKTPAPVTAQAPAQDPHCEEKPEPSGFNPTETQNGPQNPESIEDVIGKIRVLLLVPSQMRVVANKFRLLKGKAGISELSEPDTRHLLTLLLCQEHIGNGGDYAATARTVIEKAGKTELHELGTKDAWQLLRWLDEMAQDVPF